MMKYLLLCLPMVLYFPACSKSEQETAQQKASDHQVYETINAPLEKAKNSEKQILDNAEKQKNELDKAESGQ